MTREEAINKLVNARYADEFQGDEELTTAHLMAIKALEQEPKWIPCSERLPELREPVLTFDGRCICVERRIEWVDTPEGLFDGEWWIDGYDGDEYDPIGLRDGTAIAWMPLPEPYKAERKEVNDRP